MTIHDFISMLSMLSSQFEDYWEQNSQEFPRELETMDEWMDQFNNFLSVTDGEDE